MATNEDGEKDVTQVCGGELGANFRRADPEKMLFVLFRKRLLMV